MFKQLLHYKLPLIALAALIILPLFFWGGPDGYSWPALREFWNLGHFVFFALPGLFWQWWKGPAGWRAWLGLTMAGLVVGVAIEVVQSFVGRDVDVQDVYHDLVGLWLGLAWGSLTANRWWLRLLVSCLLIPSFYKLSYLAYAQYHQLAQLPQLNNFESSWDMVFARGDVTRDCSLAAAGNCSLRVRMGEHQYAGGKLEIYGGDWRGANTLAMDFYNPEPQPFLISLRVSDLEHERGAHSNEYTDRFNRSYLLQPGWNALAIPLSDLASAPATRTMVLNQIYLLEFFSAKLEHPQFIYWDNLRLD